MKASRRLSPHTRGQSLTSGSSPTKIQPEIDELFRRHVAQVTPRTVRFSIRTNLTAKPALIERDHPAVRAAARAYREGFEPPRHFCARAVRFLWSAFYGRRQGIPTVLMGFALPDDRMHAPNEKFHLANLYRCES